MSKEADSQVQSVLKSLIGMHSQIKTYYNFLNKPIQKNCISAFFFFATRYKTLGYIRTA